MEISIASDLSEYLKKAHLNFFSSKSSPQVWGIITKLNNESDLEMIAKTRKKLSSVRNSTDRYESSAAGQALRVMNVFENWLKENKTEAYDKLQEL